MPTLTVAGHDVTVGDEFEKLSNEDKQAMVNHIAEHLPAEKSAQPSGAIAGLQHGLQGVIDGPLATAGLITGKPDTPADPNYRSAPIFDKDGVHPGNIMQSLAEAAPGLTADILAGKTGASIGSKVGGVRGGVIGGLGGFIGSSLLRNFGHGAHENADARTGTPNSPVETSDILREGGKQALEAVPNALLGGRYGAGKALAEAALTKLGKTVATGAGTGFANDAIDQLGTTIGSKDGVSYDPYRGANSAATGAVLNAAMATPRAAADAASSAKYGKFEADAPSKAATVALANRLAERADGEKFVGLTGSTKQGTSFRDDVHADIHKELSAATKGEDALSQGSANVLDRINKGGKASDSELEALSNEASPETVHLARQALQSAKLKAMGDSGGLSGSMEGLGPIARPGTYIGGAVLGSGIPGIGHLALPALGSVYGAYSALRGVDKMAGLRSPAEGLMKRYADPSVPINTPMEAAPPEDLGPTPQALKKEALSNIQVHEGMAKIAKQIADQKKKGLVSDALPLLKQLAISVKPVEEPQPELPNISPIALKMTQARLKAGLPPEPAPAPEPAPEPAPAPVISPIAQKMLNTRLKAGLPPAPAPVPEPAPAPPPAPVISPIAQKMLQQKLKQGLPTDPEPAPPPGPQFNPTALAMVQKKMKQGLPDAPASPEIAAAMQSVASHAAPETPVSPAPPAAPVPPVAAPVSSMADILAKLNGAQAPQAPQEAPAPVAKITKKSGEDIKQEEGYRPIPAETQWRNGLSHDDVIAHEMARMTIEPGKEPYVRAAIKNKRDAIYTGLERAAAQADPVDAPLMTELKHQLDHHSHIDNGKLARDHYASRMTTAGSLKVHSLFTDKRLEKLFKKKKKHE